MHKFIVLNIVLIILCSCTNKSLLRQQELRKLDKTDIVQQISVLKKSKNYSSQEEFLKNFDLGILYHYNLQYDSSLFYLQTAEKIADELYARSVTNEASALLINDNMRPYRPKSYEEIMLYDFIALNYLALGKFDEALVESRKGTLFLEKQAGEAPAKYSSDGFFNYWSALAYDNQQEMDNAQISLYHSLKGYRKNQRSLPPQLAAYAYQSFKRGGRGDDIREFDLQNSSTAVVSDSSKREIILICYGGITPDLSELKFWGTYIEGGLLMVYHKDSSGKTISESMPAPIIATPVRTSGSYSRNSTNKISGKTHHLSFALPQKQASKSQTERFTAEYNGQTYYSETVASTESLLDQYLNDEQNSILLRTVIRVATRTLAAEATKSTLKNKDNVVNLLINLGIDLFSDQLEQADLRNSLFLPKTIQMIRIPYQNGDVITVRALSGNGTVLKSDAIQLDSENKNIKLFHTFNCLK